MPECQLVSYPNLRLIPLFCPFSRSLSLTQACLGRDFKGRDQWGGCSFPQGPIRA